MEKTKNEPAGEARNAVPDVIPAGQRTSWLKAAYVFWGCDLCIPIMFVGAKLSQGLSFTTALVCMLAGLTLGHLFFTTVGASLGADSGRAGANLCRCAFGTGTSRTLISLMLVYMNMGWYGSHVAVASRAGLSAAGIDYTNKENFWIFVIVTVVLGVLFVIPALKGEKLIAKISSILVPVVILIFVWAVVKTLGSLGGIGEGFRQLVNHKPSGSMTITAAITMILGSGASQWVMFADYSRRNRNILPDSYLAPSVGNIPVCFFIYGIGLVLASTTDTWDIIDIMSNKIGMPGWGLLCVMIAQMTTMVVAAYSCGLALANMFNIKSDKGKLIATVCGSMIGTLFSIFGILDQLDKFLGSIGILFPPVATMLAIDHFIIRRRKWEQHEGFNWICIGALALGVFAAVTIKTGYAPFISSFTAGLLYYAGMLIQAKTKPGRFTPQSWREGDFSMGPDQKVFLWGRLLGLAVCALAPFVLPSPASDVAVWCGGLVTFLSFCAAVKDYTILGGVKGKKGSPTPPDAPVPAE